MQHWAICALPNSSQEETVFCQDHFQGWPKCEPCFAFTKCVLLWRSTQRTRWPLRVGSKLPSAVMAHQPNGRFPGSVCGYVHVQGLKLNVVHANMLQRKLHFKLGYLAYSGQRWST